MSDLEPKVNDCKVVVRAGLGGENSDVYAWVDSPIPDWVKTVDNPVYRLHTGNALEAAKKIARKTGRDITLRLSVDYHP